MRIDSRYLEVPSSDEKRPGAAQRAGTLYIVLCFFLRYETCVYTCYIIVSHFEAPGVAQTPPKPILYRKGMP